MLLLNIPLQHISRSFIRVDYRPMEQHCDCYILKDGKVLLRKSLLQKYYERHPNLNYISFLDYILWYSYDKAVYRNDQPTPNRREQHHIPYYMPIYKSDTQAEDYARI